MKNANQSRKLSNPINELIKRIDQLEKKVLQLERNNLTFDENGNEELKQGVEYIRTIESGNKVSEYQWLDEDWDKYCIKFEDVSGEWEINFRKNAVHLYIGCKIKFYIIGRKLSNYRILSDEQITKH